MPSFPGYPGDLRDRSRRRRALAPREIAGAGLRLEQPLQLHQHRVRLAFRHARVDEVPPQCRVGPGVGLRVRRRASAERTVSVRAVRHLNRVAPLTTP